MGKSVGAILGDIYDAWRAKDLDWLASYLPDEFCHVMHFPTELHPSAGMCRGKRAVLERWRSCVADYEILAYDTSELIIDNHRAAVEIPLHYRHKPSGRDLVMTKANFWRLEEGWPIELTEYYDLKTLGSFMAGLRRA